VLINVVVPPSASFLSRWAALGSIEAPLPIFGFLVFFSLLFFLEERGQVKTRGEGKRLVHLKG